MKYLFSFAFLGFMLFAVNGQQLSPNSYSASYFGEMITHPGARLTLNYTLHSGSGERKNREINHTLALGPSAGMFYHKDYQTGVFILPELSYIRKNEKSRIFGAGIGAGYLRTFIPNVYGINPTGEVEKMKLGYNYFLTELFLTFGKSLKELPVDLFFKPEFLLAYPNFPGSVGYFVMEIGINYRLQND